MVRIVYSTCKIYNVLMFRGGLEPTYPLTVSTTFIPAISACNNNAV